MTRLCAKLGSLHADLTPPKSYRLLGNFDFDTTLPLVADFTFTITVRKGRRIQILHDDLGYAYSNPVVDSGDSGNLIWRCSKDSCTAQVTIKDDTVTGCQRYHNHPHKLLQLYPANL